MISRRRQKEIGEETKRKYVRIKALQKAGLDNDKIARILGIKTAEIRNIQKVGNRHFEGAH